MSRSKKMKAISSEVGKISFATTMVRQLSVSDDCPTPSLQVPSKEYTDFLTELPKINDNNTITFNFRDDKNFLVEIPGGLAGIQIIPVYFLPKGTKVEDLSYKRGNPYLCFYDTFLPSGVLAASIQAKSVGPRGNREGMLKFNVENMGYTGLNGNVRLYLNVYLEYRNTWYAFYVN